MKKTTSNRSQASLASLRLAAMKSSMILLAGLFAALPALHAANLVVGDGTANNSTNFTSGTNTFDSFTIGNSNTSYNNSITVANTNTLLQIDPTGSSGAANYVGYSGYSNNLIITNGGRLVIGGSVLKYLAIGYNTNSSNNSVLVSGSNSLLSSAGYISFGYNGSSNSMTISNGGSVTSVRDFTVGGGYLNNYYGGGSNNTLTVSSGSLSVSDGGSGIYIGNYGSCNRMVIANGGTVSGYYGIIGEAAWNGSQTVQSVSNSVIVRDAGSVWSNNFLSVGGNNNEGDLDGSWNSLTVSNQGKVISSRGYIGYGAGSSNNSVLVTGTNSAWSNSGSLYVGNSGDSNTLTVSNGAVVSSANTYLGYNSGANSNIVTVTGTGSVLTNSGYNYIGYNGSSNSLRILNGGLVVDSGAASAYEVIGNSTAAVGNSVLVAGSNSRWTVTPVLDFRGVQGSLVVSNGGTATFSDKLRIGNVAGANSNSVVVSDANSFLSVGTYMTVGGAATRGNSVVVSNGASMTSYGTLIGSGGSNNSMTIAERSTFSNGVGSLYVGDAAAASNVLTVSGASTATVNGPVYLGNATNSYGNSILVTGSNTFFTNVGVFYVGNYGDSNTLTVSGGASLGVFTRLTIGEQTGASGNSVTVDGAGSLLAIPGVYVGSYGSNSSLNVTGGGTVQSGFTRLGGEGTPNNSVLVSGAGSVLTNSGDIRIGAASGSGSTNNSLTISNGGTVYAANSYVGYSGNNHWATVTGVGSLWSNSGSLAIGGSSTGNVLALNDQGTVMASNITVAANNTLSGNGTVTTTSGTTISGFFAPSGTNSFTVNGGLTFTSSGNFLWNLFANSADTTGYTNFTAPVTLNGLLSVTNGSSLTVNLSTNITNGAFWSNAQSWTLMTGTNVSAGTNFTLAFSGNTNQSFNTNFYFALRTTTNALLLVYALPDLYIGSNNVQQVYTNFTSGTNSYGNTYIGYGFSSGNNLNVSGASTVLTNTENLYLGYQGNGNGLGIDNGATVAAVDVQVGSVSNIGNVLTLNNGAKLIASNVTVTGAEPNANGIYGNGTITAPGGVVIDVGGTIKPSGIGTPLTINGPLKITNGGSYTWSINESTTNAVTPGQYFSAPLQLSGLLTVSTNAVAYYDLNWGYNVRSVDELWFSTNIVTFAVMTGTNTASIQAATNLVLAYYGSDQFQGFHTTNFFLTASNSTVYLNYTNGQALWNAPSGEWSNSGNWSNSTPPTLTVNGRIDNGGSATVNTNATAYNLSVGLYTSANSLRITNGGNLLVGDPNWNLGGGGSTAIGNSASSSNNSVLVDGASATWTNVSGLYVGYYGASNSLVITNGGTVANWTGIVGFGSASSNNSVVVTGSNSVLTNSGDFYVGLYGSGNRLLVTNGGKLYNGGANWDADQASGAIIGAYQANSNSVIVTGSNSAWINSSALSIGGQSAGNSLVISDGALMSVAGYISDSRGAAYYQTTIGSAGGQSNSVLVTGTNSTFTNAYGFILGNVANNNTITVTNGGQLLSAGPGDTIGLYGGSGNTLLVSGTNSLYRTTGLLLGSGAGCSGNGMIISNGAIAITPSLTVGGYDSSDNYVMVTGVGSKLYATNGFAVAFHSGSDTLTVANGGSLYGANSGADGIGSYGADCTLLITDQGSLYTNNALLAVGSYGTIRNLFIVSNGATASIGSLQVGSVATSSNSVIVSGTNSVLTVAGTTYVGARFDAVDNNLIVTNGGRVVMGGNIFLGQGQGSVGNTIQVYGSSTLSSASNTTIGSGGSTNSALVSGSNALWSNAGSITIGSGSTNNSLVITNAGKVISGEGLVIGSQSNDLSNSVLVTGVASRMEASGTNVIGDSGMFNTLTISNGGLVTGSDGIIGKTSNSFSNSVLVTGTGSLWSNASSLTIGFSGSGNSLLISNGGRVYSSYASIGTYNASSNNSALVTGSNSLWSNAAGMQVGGAYGGNGTLTIASNGTVLSGYLSIGEGSNSSGNSVLVTGVGSTLSNASIITIGQSGSGNRLVITNGGVVVNQSNAILGYNANSSNNSVVVSGANSRWSTGSGVYDGLYVGLSGSGNSLIIENGGRVDSVNAAIGVSNSASNNSVLVRGSGSLWSNSRTLYVGVGSTNGGIGNVLSLDNHASVIASNIIVASGNTLTGNGTVTTTSGATISGGTFAPTGTNALTVNGNLTFTNGGIYLWNLFANSTNNPSSGTNYTVPVVLNGDLSVTTDSIFNVNFGTNVSSSASYWTNNIQWTVMTGTNVSAGTSFGLSFTGNTNGLLLGNFSLITNSGSLDLVYTAPAYWQTNTQPWTNGLNWTSLTVPTNRTTAYIDNGGTSVLWTNGSVNILEIGSTNSSSGTLLITNGGSLSASHVIVGNAGSGTVTITSGGSLTSSNITIANQSGSDGVVNIGTYGGNETNVTLLAPTVTFGIGTGSIYFNQADTLTNNSVYVGTNAFNTVYGQIVQQGTGTTILTGVGGTNSANIVVSSGMLEFRDAVFSTYGNIWMSNSGATMLVNSNSIVNVNSPIYQGGIRVGYRANQNTLTIASGGQLIVGFSGLGLGTGGNNNSILVTGPGSLLDVSLGGIGIANKSSNNSITISAGGRLIGSTNTSYSSGDGDFIGTFGTNNSILVTGLGSLYSNNSALNVGYGLSGASFAPAKGNSLVISNNGTVTIGALYLGNITEDVSNSVTVYGNSTLSIAGSAIIGSGDASSNSVIVTGSNAVFRSGGLTVGSGSSLGSVGNSLVISNGGNVQIDSLTIGNVTGDNSNSVTVYGDSTLTVTNSSSQSFIGNNNNNVGAVSGNLVTVTGSNAVFVNNGYLYIGGNYDCDGNALVVSNGGSVIASQGLIIGYGYYNSNNQVIVTGAGSSLYVTNGLQLGWQFQQVSNNLLISAGAQITADNVNIGYGDTGYNSLIVDGPTSVLNVSGSIAAGVYGSTGNVLEVTNRGTIIAQGGISISSGNFLKGNGTITATGGTTISGTFAPAGTNALTVNGDLTFTGGTYLWNLYDNSTNNPSSGINYTVPVALNGSLSVAANSVFDLNFGGTVNGSFDFWTNSRQWQVMQGNNPLTSGTNFNLAWASAQSGAGLSIDLFSLTASNNSLYLNYNAGEITTPVIAPGTTDLPSYTATNTVLVITAPTNGTAVLADSNPGLVGIVLKSGTLDSTNQNSIPTNASVRVYDGNMGFTGPGTNTIGSLFVAGGQIGASNTIVNVQSFVQTGGTLSGGTNATYWAANYYFAATNPALVAAALDNLGTVAGFHSTAIVTTNESGAPVAPVVFDNNMSYDGGTVITGGILQLGGSNSSGAVSVQGIITNNGFLNYGYNGNSTTPTNEVIGSGVIGQVGTGTLTIGSNGITGSFTGSFAVANGTLELTTNSALGNSTNFYLANNGTLYAATGVTNITNVNVTNGTGIIDNASGATLALNGTLTKSGSVLVLAGGSFDVNAQVTGSGAPGSFDSDLVISNATATLVASNNNYAGPTYVVAGSTLSNGIVNALPSNTVLNIGATTDGAVTNRFDMAGYNQTIAGLASAGGASNIVTTSTGATTLTLDDSYLGTAINTTYSGTIDGVVALIRAGTGSTLLTGANTYSGGTTINSGRLITQNIQALGSGGVALNGGTLEVRSLLNIASLNWSGGQIALPNAGSGQYVVVTGAGTPFTSTGVNTFNLTGASLTVGTPTALLGATNIMGYSTNDFTVTGVESYQLLLSNNILWIDLLAAPTPVTPLYPDFAQYAVNRNQANVATALNSFTNHPNSDQTVVLNSLVALTNSPAQMQQAFNAIMPNFYQQIATIAFNNANAQNMQLNQRLWGVRLSEGGGFSMSGLADNFAMIQEGQGDGSGAGKGVLDSKKDILRPGLDNHWGMFVDGNGIFAQANSGNMLPGYNSQSGGVTTGLTYKWNDNFASGIYAGYQGTYNKSGAAGSGLGVGSTLIDNAVRFGVFGTYGSKDGKGLYANALAGGGYHNFQASRVIQYTGVNRTANSAPGAGELDTMLATGYDIQKGKFTFGPTASLQYTYLGVNSLNETGAQSLNFNSGGWNSSSMLSSVGAHAAYNWQAGKNVIVVPQVSLSWQHEFMQNPYAIGGNLGGTSPNFSNWSTTPIRDFLYTGVGFTVELNKKWNTSFFYNAAAGNSDLTSQNIFWSAGVKF